MMIPGEWYVCDDGETRPVFRGEVRAADRSWVPTEFLADTGADQTTLTTLVWSALGLESAGDAGRVSGLGGLASATLVESALRLYDTSGRPVVINTPFLALTDPSALDMSVLGRDLMNLFALIVDRPGKRVCLLGQNHSYRVVEAGGP
jgi:hypothetical protein